MNWFRSECHQRNRTDPETRHIRHQARSRSLVGVKMSKNSYFSPFYGRCNLSFAHLWTDFVRNATNATGWIQRPVTFVIRPDQGHWSGSKSRKTRILAHFTDGVTSHLLIYEPISFGMPPTQPDGSRDPSHLSSGPIKVIGRGQNLEKLVFSLIFDLV